MSKYDYECEFYQKYGRIPTKKELAKYILLNKKGWGYGDKKRQKKNNIINY